MAFLTISSSSSSTTITCNNTEKQKQHQHQLQRYLPHQQQKQRHSRYSYYFSWEAKTKAKAKSKQKKSIINRLLFLFPSGRWILFVLIGFCQLEYSHSALRIRSSKNQNQNNNDHPYNNNEIPLKERSSWTWRNNDNDNNNNNDNSSSSSSSSHGGGGGSKRNNNHNKHSHNHRFFFDPNSSLENNNNNNNNNNQQSNTSSLTGMLYESIDHVYSTIIEDIRRPIRDIWDGMYSGLSLFWTGYYQGFSGLVFDFPTEGYINNGIIGLFQGTIAGAFHFSVMTVSGAAAGMYQFVRGMQRTYEAIQFTKEGKIWNTITKEWFFYSLDEEVKELEEQQKQQKQQQKQQQEQDQDQTWTKKTKQQPSSSNPTQQQQSSSSSPRRLRKHVKDQSFYDFLQVPVDASSADIKKAYYRQALEVHPDKSTEAEAEDIFRTLNTVYKTLVSEETRALYDTHGVCFSEYMEKDNNDNNDNNNVALYVDPYTFFNILFGTGVIGPYVGDLAIASIVDNALLLTDKAEPNISLGELKFNTQQQLRRQVDIASHLRERIERYTTLGYETLEEFQLSCRTEAESLALAMMTEGKLLSSDLMLEAISSGLLAATTSYLVPTWAKPLLGWVYGAVDVTQNWQIVHDLEKSIRQAVQDIENETTTKTTTRTTTTKENNNDNDEDDDNQTSGSSSYFFSSKYYTNHDCNQNQNQHQQYPGKNNGSDEIDRLLQKLSVPKMLKLIWKFNVNDISRTVREASRRVLDDCGSDIQLRDLKAKALNILGREFHSAAVEERRKQQQQNRKTSNTNNDGGKHHQHQQQQQQQQQSKKDTFPDVQTIHENVQLALLESVVSKSFF